MASAWPDPAPKDLQTTPQISPAAWRSDVLQAAQRSQCRGRTALAGVLKACYRVERLQALVRRACLRLEGGALFSETIRDILRLHHGVTICRYSYGDILRPGVLTPGCTVGAYCSVGQDLIVRRRNHPVERISQTPLFYNRKLGLVRRDTIDEDRENPLTIGHDVWIGDRVTILSGCRRIGNGAVLAAGSVVTKDVAAYEIVAGVPATLLRHRYPETLQVRLEATRWWELPLPDLLKFAPHLLCPAAELDTDVLDRLADAASKRSV